MYAPSAISVNGTGQSEYNLAMPDPKQVYKVNGLMLDDPTNEEGSLALDYYLNACAHLLNVLNADPKLRKSPLADLLGEVFAFFETEPSEGDDSKAGEAAEWLGLFGVVGKALWFLRNKDDAQLRRELKRLATEPSQVIGNRSSVLHCRNARGERIRYRIRDRTGRSGNQNARPACKQGRKEHLD